VVVAVVLAAQQSWSDAATLGYVAVYAGNYAWAAGHLAGPVQHCWSLAIEEQFYIVWPLVLLLLLKTKSRKFVITAVAIAICLLAVHRIAGNGPSQSDLTTDMRADELLVGCLFACGFAWFKWSRIRWWPVALLTFPVVVLDIVDNIDLRGIGYTLIAFVFAAIIAAALTCRPVQEMLSAAPLVSLGAISYSLYLWHYPVLYWMRGGTSAQIYDATILNSVLGLVISLALALLSYHFVEARFRRRRPSAPGEARVGPGDSRTGGVPDPV